MKQIELTELMENHYWPLWAYLSVYFAAVEGPNSYTLNDW